MLITTAVITMVTGMNAAAITRMVTSVIMARVMNVITRKAVAGSLIISMQKDIAMLDVEVYLEKLSIFGRLLRQEGMEVSPRETGDACTILCELGFEDRSAVKTALRTVYAKSRDEQIKFDRVFDSFFLSEDVIRALDKKHQEEELQRRQAIEQAQKDLEEQTPSSEFTKDQIEAYSQLSQQEKERLRKLREKFADSSTDRSEKLYSGFIHSIFAKSILEQQIKMEDAALGAAAVDPEIGMIFREISDFKDNEIPKAVMYIQNIASQINGELTKKKNSSGQSSALDFKKTIRKGLETGGSFYRLAYKKKRSKKKQLLMLCDVSASMIQFSEFALRFIQALNQSAESSRVLLFSEESVEADPFRLQNMDLFRDYVKQSGVYGRGTNLGAALKKINDQRPSALSSSTVLIIISDAKSVNMDLVCRELERARARAGKVICLNPIPESKWKYSGSIMSAAQYCTMLSCSTLEELGAACRRLALM